MACAWTKWDAIVVKNEDVRLDGQRECDQAEAKASAREVGKFALEGEDSLGNLIAKHMVCKKHYDSKPSPLSGMICPWC